MNKRKTSAHGSFCLVAGALLAAMGIALGAFAAHGLKARLGADALGWWHTGVQYQMWNAIGLVALAAAPPVRTAALLVLAGTCVFSGSLYLMALTDARWLGAVTPAGGALMIVGWLLAAWRGLRAA
jgi:uncharacterized membrane protein YgdD (TMEM256/DUF423 family)